jgi:hypothetical protein
VLFQPGSELVVVPCREDVVLGVVELLGGLGRGVGSLRGEGLVAGRGLDVGGRDRGGSLVSGVAVDGGRSSRGPAIVSFGLFSWGEALSLLVLG